MSTNIWTSSSSTAYSTPGNWSLSAVPVNSDVVYVTQSAVSMASGLSQSAVTLTSLNIDMGYSGLIGLSTAYLNIGATTTNIGTPVISNSVGSRRVNLQLANSGAIVNVFNSAGTGNDTGFTPVRLLVTSGVLNLSGGVTGVALYAGETSSITTLVMTNSPTLYLGAGNTLTTGTANGGTIYNYSTNTTTLLTLNNSATLYHYGSGAYTTLTINSGTANYLGTGTITTLNLTGTLDLSAGTGAVTITNANIYAGGKIIDPLRRLTFTNQPTLSGYLKTIQYS